jgi:hypothetical protein
MLLSLIKVSIFTRLELYSLVQIKQSVCWKYFTKLSFVRSSFLNTHRSMKSFLNTFPMQDRLPVTVQCLSHSSAHVRATSLARLRDMLYFKLHRSKFSNGSLEQAESIENDDGRGVHWREAIEQCITWEAHYRRAGGMSISLLANAATALGCSLPS